MRSPSDNQSGVLEWLLQPGDPSIRLLTLRHLLNRPLESAEAQQASAAITDSPPAKRILSRQNADGSWGKSANPYLPKYKSSYWTLMLLGHLAVPYGNEPVRRAVDHILTFQQPCGGFATYEEDNARVEYEFAVKREAARGKPAPDEQSFLENLLREMTLSCLTGNVVSALVRLGYGRLPEAARAVDWLIQIQNADGGWLCPYWSAHLRDKHSCFYGTISALEALAEMLRLRPSTRLRQAADRGAEFLLLHRLYRADHHDWQPINPQWLRLSFPWFYGYSILRGLWVLGLLGCCDERAQDALSVLLERRTPDGRWVLEHSPYGRMAANLEKVGQPSKWVTLHALWAVRNLTSGASSH
ncbi:MAG TPA: prenyltransferase/squalene oxidase repeat-containing protein [Anaerolineae bacterium]|nr:prenyltransferase/squalene oxidase repeat-containing protein [Anaerolineae bacterium]